MNHTFPAVLPFISEFIFDLSLKGNCRAVAQTRLSKVSQGGDEPMSKTVGQFGVTGSSRAWGQAPGPGPSLAGAKSASACHPSVCACGRSGHTAGLCLFLGCHQSRGGFVGRAAGRREAEPHLFGLSASLRSPAGPNQGGDFSPKWKRRGEGRQRAGLGETSAGVRGALRGEP